jgi:hypothetical protein
MHAAMLIPAVSPVKPMPCYAAWVGTVPVYKYFKYMVPVLHKSDKTHVPGQAWTSVADPGCLSRSHIFSITDPGPPSKTLSIFTQKIVSKLSEIWSGLFIPDLDPDFLPIPDPNPSLKCLCLFLFEGTFTLFFKDKKS